MYQIINIETGEIVFSTDIHAAAAIAVSRNPKLAFYEVA